MIWCKSPIVIIFIRKLFTNITTQHNHATTIYFVQKELHRANNVKPFLH